MGLATNDYHFVTRWRVRASADEVLAILRDAESLPRWWPSVYLDVRVVEPGQPGTGLGKTADLWTRGLLPYTLRWSFRVIEELRDPIGFTLVASGDFEGRGTWRIEADGDCVDIVYDWQVRAQKPLLQRLSFLLRPVFAMNHRWAMARGEESLRLELLRRRAESPTERDRIPKPPGADPKTGRKWWFGSSAVVVAAFAFAILYAPGGPRPIADFDPDRVANLEVEMWKAYYAKKNAELFTLLVVTLREQYRLSWFRATQTGFHLARAAARFARMHDGYERVLPDLELGYREIRESTLASFDPHAVAESELAWWVARRKSDEDDQNNVGTLIGREYVALYGESANREGLMRAGALRAEAARLRDDQADHPDWEAIGKLVRDSYASLYAAAHAK